MALIVANQVIDAFIAAVTGLTTTGANVFNDRERKLAETDLPALRVYSDPEEVRADNVLDSPHLQYRTINLRCEAVAKETVDLDDKLDLMCNEVEKAIGADSTLGGICKLHCVLESTAISQDDRCDVPAGKATMNWKATALTMSNAPDVAL